MIDRNLQGCNTRRWLHIVSFFLTLALVSSAANLASVSAQAVDDPFADENAPPPPSPAVVEAEDRIRHALDQPVTYKFVDAPLDEAMATLSQLAKIDISVSPRVQQEFENVDFKVTAAGRQVRLRSALNRILRQIELEYTVANESLLVTTSEETEELLATRAYPVADLLTCPVDGCDPEQGAVELEKFIQTLIRAHSWKDVGGWGTASTAARTLVVNQDYRTQCEVEQLLASLRRAPAVGGPLAGKLVEPLATAPQSIQETKIDAALAQKLTWSFRNRTLRELTDALSAKYGITVELDLQSLNDIGMAPETKVSVEAYDVTLGAALRRLLQPLELTYNVLDDALLITTPEVVESNLSIVLYPVYDLLDLPVGAGCDDVAFDKLRALIEENVAQSTWETVGGPGSLMGLRGRAVLGCSQTQEVQAKVAELLAKIRAARAAQLPSPVPPEDPNRMVTRIYRLWQHTPGVSEAHIPVVGEQHATPRHVAAQQGRGPATDPKGRLVLSPQELEGTIARLVFPGSWDPAIGVVLHADGDRLTVHHFPATIKEVERVLDKLHIHHECTELKMP